MFYIFSTMKILFLVSFIYSVTCLQIGDECDSLSGKGRCSLLRDCQENTDMKTGKILPTVCGYKDFELVVCCPKKISGGKHFNSDRISIQKCKEYGDGVFKLLSTENRKDYLSVNISLCPNAMEENSSSIYAKQKEFPHMALIGSGPENKKNWICTGNLISEKFILTVAHCTATFNKNTVKWVRLGDLDFESVNDNSEYLEYSVKKIHSHPGYSRQQVYNDIALLELDSPVTFSENIRPACLYSGIDVVDMFIGSGWALGPLSKIGNIGHLRQSKKLKKVEYKECGEAYNILKRRQMFRGIDERTMICIKGKTEGACDMSSGSALEIHSKVYCMYEIVGVASFGKKICGDAPVVYTKVSTYINWIESIVWPQVIQM